MTTSVKELRELAIAARRENSNERQERYVRARDEAFELLTDGVMERIRVAATEGRFRFPIYRWTNQSRFQTDATTAQVSDDGEGNAGVPEATQLYFGNDESGKNGLHIMALVQPVGIPYQDTLIAKLREFFESQTAPGEDADGKKSNMLRVFLQKRPVRQCAIFVSWDRNQSTQIHRRGPFVPRPQTSPTQPPPAVRERTTDGGFQPRVPFRGAGLFRGGNVRGGPVRGRGRGRGGAAPPAQ